MRIYLPQETAALFQAAGDDALTVRDQAIQGTIDDTLASICQAEGLEEQEQRRQLELEALRAEITAGRASGPTKSAGDVFTRLEAKYEAQSSSGRH